MNKIMTESSIFQHVRHKLNITKYSSAEICFL